LGVIHRDTPTTAITEAKTTTITINGRGMHFMIQR
jgi:hypothetical protein